MSPTRPLNDSEIRCLRMAQPCCLNGMWELRRIPVTPILAGSIFCCRCISSVQLCWLEGQNLEWYWQRDKLALLDLNSQTNAELADLALFHCLGYQTASAHCNMGFDFFFFSHGSVLFLETCEVFDQKVVALFK